MAWCAIFIGHLAQAQLAMGDYQQALRSVSRGLADVAGGGPVWVEPELHRIRGTVYAGEGKPDEEIAAAYQLALEKSRTQPHRIYELRAAFSLARLWQKRGQAETATTLMTSLGLSNDESSVLLDWQAADSLLRGLKGQSRPSLSPR